MQLKGTDITATIRITQPDDATDIQIDLLTAGVGDITTAFYTLLFYDLLNGTVSGEDDPVHSITTGISFKLKRADGSTITETSVAKLDWYESSGYYYIDAVSLSTLSLAEQTVLTGVDIYYVGKDTSSSTETRILIAESTAPQSSSFAEEVGSAKGIVLDPSKGEISLKCVYRTMITK